MISDTEAQELQKNSLNIAKELDLFQEETLRDLETVKISVKPREDLAETDQRILFGYALLPDENQENPEIIIQERNLAEILPKKLKQILNQSAMDHEIIGHIGHYFLGEDGTDEETACVTQFRMARRRAANSKIWFLIAILIPIFQKLHRGISLTSYFNCQR